MQQSERRRMRPLPRRGEPVASVDVRRVIIRFTDTVDLPYEDGAERHLGAEWQTLADKDSFRLNRLFTALAPDELTPLIARAKEHDPDLPNFLKFFVVDVPASLDARVLVEKLRSWPAVATVYLDAPATDPAVNPDDDDPGAGWVQNQGYLDPAPDGIDAEFAWPRADGTGFNGGDGAGVRFIDFEQGWNLSHPDLQDHNIQLLHGVIRPASVGHGTATLGVVCARDNLIGCVGVAPWVDEVGVVSHFQSTKPDALLAAISNLDPGDVLLIEAQHAEVMVGPATWFAMPLETLEAEFWLIRLATALGIHVIEAAGNSFEKLDNFVDGAGKKPLARGEPSFGFRDSGAIVVSAATACAPHEPQLDDIGERMYHYGTRVDCYAWGENVTTLTETDYILGGYASTSAAAAIIAGAAIILQGIAKAQGRPLSPAQLRAVLSNANNGTESRNGIEVDGIGVMPDFRKILLTNDALNLLPDVYLRDFFGDTGDPHLGAISASPDVLVVPNPVNDPQTAFGDPNILFDSHAEAGQDNFIHVRAWNRGTSDAEDVRATVYWSEVATLVSPDQWTLVGTVVIPKLNTGSIMTVSPGIEWSADQISNTGHYCFVAILDHPMDPGQTPTDLASLVAAWKLDWANFERFIRGNNNITWRNFNVVDNLPDPLAPYARVQPFDKCVPLPFLVVGAPDQARPMQLRVVANLPRGSRLFLDAPASLQGWAVEAFHPSKRHRLDEHKHLVELELGAVTSDKLTLPANSRQRMALFVQAPSNLHGDAHEVHVSQLFMGKEVGRVTWRLVDERYRRGILSKIRPASREPA